MEDKEINESIQLNKDIKKILIEQLNKIEEYLKEGNHFYY